MLKDAKNIAQEKENIEKKKKIIKEFELFLVRDWVFPRRASSKEGKRKYTMVERKNIIRSLLTDTEPTPDNVVQIPRLKKNVETYDIANAIDPEDGSVNKAYFVDPHSELEYNIDPERLKAWYKRTKETAGDINAAIKAAEAATKQLETALEEKKTDLKQAIIEFDQSGLLGEKVVKSIQEPLKKAMYEISEELQGVIDHAKVDPKEILDMQAERQPILAGSIITMKFKDATEEKYALVLPRDVHALSRITRDQFKNRKNPNGLCVSSVDYGAYNRTLRVLTLDSNGTPQRYKGTWNGSTIITPNKIMEAFKDLTVVEMVQHDRKNKGIITRGFVSGKPTMVEPQEKGGLPTSGEELGQIICDCKFADPNNPSQVKVTSGLTPYLNIVPGTSLVTEVKEGDYITYYDALGQQKSFQVKTPSNTNFETPIEGTKNEKCFLFQVVSSQSTENHAYETTTAYRNQIFCDESTYNNQMKISVDSKSRSQNCIDYGGVIISVDDSRQEITYNKCKPGSSVPTEQPIPASVWHNRILERKFLLLSEFPEFEKFDATRFNNSDIVKLAEDYTGKEGNKYLKVNWGGTDITKTPPTKRVPCKNQLGSDLYIDAYKYDYVIDGELPELKRGYIVAKKDGRDTLFKIESFAGKPGYETFGQWDSPNKPQAGCWTTH